MIVAENLTKYYGSAVGIKDLNFNLLKGKLYGFIGPNGAGKSTTIKTLLGFLYEYSGKAYINNLDIDNNLKEIKTFTGYAPSDVRLYPNIKVKELFSYNKNFYKDVDTSSELDRLIKLFDIDINKRIKELSMGNKKKVSLILAMVFNPDVLILDEPTSGLDPIIQERFFQELKSRTKKGVTILLSSHNLSEVEDYADYVIFIAKGRIINKEDIKNIKSYKIITVTSGNFEVINKKDILKKEGKSISFKFSGNGDELLELLNKIKPLDMVIENKKLDTYFKDFYKGDVK